MGMPLTLVSNHRNLEIRPHAKFSYRCGGKNASPSCALQINKGEQYVAWTEWAVRGTPRGSRVKVDLHKFCVHCALAKFVDIKIAAHASRSHVN